MMKFHNQHILSFLLKLVWEVKTLWVDIISNFLFLVLIHPNQDEESTIGRNISRPVILMTTDHPLSLILG